MNESKNLLVIILLTIFISSAIIIIFKQFDNFFPHFGISHKDFVVSTKGNISIYGATHYSNKTFKKGLIINGSFNGNNLKINTLTVIGACNLENSRIKNEALIRGSLAVDESIFNATVRVYGSLTSDETIFEKKVNVYGAVNDEESTFKDTLEVSGSLTLKNSKTQNIIIENKRPEKNYVYLKGDTIVNGSIKFVYGNGKIFVFDQAKVNGDIIGGIIERK